MTIEDIYKAIEKAPKDKKVEAARAALDSYKGDDKELISGMILEGAIVEEFS